MKTLLITIGLLIAISVSAMSLQCVQDRKECEGLAKDMSDTEKSGFFCFEDSDTNKCLADKTAEHEARETAKYKARNGDRNPPTDYFLYATNTPMVVGGQSPEAGNSKAGILAVFGAIILAFVGVLGYLRFKNNVD